jgi:DNA-binding CsgD family transcriptional regulator
MTAMTRRRPSPARRAITSRLAEIDTKRIELEKLQKAGEMGQAELLKEELDRLEGERWRVACPFLAYFHNWQGSPSQFKFYGPGAFQWNIFQHCQPEYRSEELQITFRQAQVAYGASLGLTNTQIAGVLEIKEQTVKTTVSSLYRKIGMAEGEGDRARLVLWYLAPLHHLSRQ